MKRLTISIILALLSIKSNSAVFTHTGYISRIGAIESRENGDFIILAGFTFAGTCPLSRGLVVARLRSTEYGSRAFSIGLAAKMAGKKVAITVNDSIKNENGACFINSISLEE